MSHITIANQGLEAFEAKRWEEAIDKLSQALKVSKNPSWFLARAKALQQLKRDEESLDDANLAFHTAYERSNRSLMIESHYRRGVAYMRLGQYANADCCCLYAMRLCEGFPVVEPEDIRAQHTDEHGFWTASAEAVKLEIKEHSKHSWADPSALANLSSQSNIGKEWRLASAMRLQILFAMSKLPADDPARKATVDVKPAVKELADFTLNQGTGVAVNENTRVTPNEGTRVDLNEGTVHIFKVGTGDVPQITNVAAEKPAVGNDTPPRLQDFQTDSTITVSIFSKGTKTNLRVYFLQDGARLTGLTWPNGKEKEFFFQTYAPIEASKSSYSVTPNKVELRLVKKVPGKWPQLLKEAADEPVDAAVEKESWEQLKERAARAEQGDSTEEQQTAAVAQVSEKNTSRDDAAAKAAGPAYPTSSRSGPKDWDKLEVDEDEDVNDVNKFFRTLYKDASDEQKRAMMKSFTESNGTTLSTDWNDVGSRTLTANPPDGVEAKKW